MLTIINTRLRLWNIRGHAVKKKIDCRLDTGNEQLPPVFC